MDPLLVVTLHRCSKFSGDLTLSFRFVFFVGMRCGMLRFYARAKNVHKMLKLICQNIVGKWREKMSVRWNYLREFRLTFGSFVCTNSSILSSTRHRQTET